MISKDQWGPRGYVDLENILVHSGDGLENRVIAKDLLYKFESWLRSKGWRGFGLKYRLTAPGQRGAYNVNRPIPWHVRKRFKLFVEEYDTGSTGNRDSVQHIKQERRESPL